MADPSATSFHDFRDFTNFSSFRDLPDLAEFDRNPVLDQAMLDELRPDISARADWAEDLQPTGAIVDEGDVRFLLVHHTATKNSYAQDEVPEQIRDFYRLHIGPERRWVDVAYNFLIDRYGGIWEARAGSLERAVRGDATGGSQGFSQMCSLIGNHHLEPPTAEAQDALISLLAWLGHRHRVDTTPGSVVDFISRGSNRWLKGASVQARTISGHREMSDTVCPGDFVFGMLDNAIPTEVAKRREAVYNKVAPALLQSQDQGAAADQDQGAVNPDPDLPVLRSESTDPVIIGTDADKVVLPTAAAAVAGVVGGLIAIRRRRARDN